MAEEKKKLSLEEAFEKLETVIETGTPEEIMAAGQKMYRELSPETA